MPLVALVALWAFSAAITVGAAMQLIDSKVLDSGLLRPTQALVSAMQQERAVSISYLAGRIPLERAGLAGPRAQVDRARATFRRALTSGTLRSFIEPNSAQHADELAGRLGEIDALRRSIDGRTVDRQRTLDEYSSLIDAAYGVYARVDVKEREIARDGRTLIIMGRTHELISREDALITGVLTVGRYTAAEREQFARLVAAQRYTFTSTTPYFEYEDLTGYQTFLASPELARFRALEDRMLHEDAHPSLDAQTWRDEAGRLNVKLWDVGMTAVGHLAVRGEGFAAAALVRLLLTGGLGLVAIILSVVIAFRIGRRLTREFRGLARAVNHFSDKRLPEIAEQARRGQEIDADEGAVGTEFGVTEAEDLRQAFLTSRRAVVRATVNEAMVHRAVSEAFVNLARRSQVLLQRQLKLLDSMERRSHDPTELEHLFKLDHLSTRMRRHAEGLVILSGKPAGRTWRRPVPLVDVLRGAAAEVEDYPRVKVMPPERAALAGTAVADTIHLLAELIENATQYSPPHTPVQLTGHLVPNGFVVEIEDRGLGLSPDALADLNRKLAEPPEFDLSESARLGLLVVGRLAQRHGISVMLRASPYGGTMAIVLIPPSLIEEVPEDTGTGPQAAVEAEPVKNPTRRRSVLRQQYTEASEPEPAGPTGRAGRARPAVAGDGELPRRRRQSNIVPQLRQEAVETGHEAGVDRPPEVIGTKLAAMQRGWQRGRVEAEEAEARAGSRTRSGIEEDS
jgi:hypothetical protein